MQRLAHVNLTLEGQLAAMSLADDVLPDLDNGATPSWRRSSRQLLVWAMVYVSARHGATYREAMLHALLSTPQDVRAALAVAMTLPANDPRHQRGFPLQRIDDEDPRMFGTIVGAVRIGLHGFSPSV